jgi:hypothetical protein
MQGLRFPTNPLSGGAVEILRMYYRAQMRTIGRSSLYCSVRVVYVMDNFFQTEFVARLSVGST